MHNNITYTTLNEEGVYVVHTQYPYGYFHLRGGGDVILEMFTVGQSSGDIRGYKWCGMMEMYDMEDIYKICGQMATRIREETVFNGNGLKKNLSEDEVLSILSKQHNRLVEFLPEVEVVDGKRVYI